MLDDQVLERFMHAFLGFGTLESDYWFVGNGGRRRQYREGGPAASEAAGWSWGVLP